MVQKRPSVSPVEPASAKAGVAYYRGNPRAMRRTAWATLISLFMMVVEIVAGHLTGSMALLADGWHMATHVLALGLSWLAFVLSERLARDPRLAFGSGKVEVLASFLSAFLLLGVGAWMGIESLARLLAPTDVKFLDAMVVAVVGLWVNLICALLLHQKSGDGVHHHHHHHGHGHSHHGHSHHHGRPHGNEAAVPASEANPTHDSASGTGVASENLNLKAAYLHVVADALTSILAIVALLFGQLTGFPQIDSLMGLIGAILVIVWARGLISQSGWMLLDRQAPPDLRDVVLALTGRLAPSASIEELKLWQIASGRYACNLRLAGGSPQAAVLRDALLEQPFIAHLTLEWLPANDRSDASADAATPDPHEHH